MSCCVEGLLRLPPISPPSERSPEPSKIKALLFFFLAKSDFRFLTPVTLFPKAAYVEYLNGPFLFDSMYTEDPEASKLIYLPGVPDLVDIYPSCFGTEP